MRANPGTLRVKCDSKYVVDCFVQGWHKRWAANGWRNASRKPVENQDLWQPLLEAYHEREGQISFDWVKGHGSDPTNDVVDRLATEAARTQAGRSGTKPPTALGEPDTKGPGRAPATDGRLSGVSGWRVLALGLRPPAIGGYDPTNPVAVAVRRKLKEALTGWLAIHPDVVVLTGLGLGAEQLVAEAATQAGVPYVAVLAYPDQESAWPGPTQLRYRRLLSGAAANFTLSNRQPRSKQEAGIAAGKRDRALIAATHAALVVWDEQDCRLGEQIAALEQRIPDDVWVIPPN